MAISEVLYRVQQLEQRVSRHGDRLDQVIRHEERIIDIANDVREVREEIREMKKALYTAAVSITVSAIGLVATIYLLFGQ